MAKKKGGSASKSEAPVAVLSYLANECADDLKKFCEAITAGEGRLFQCINEKGEAVRGRCRTAI